MTVVSAAIHVVELDLRTVIFRERTTNSAEKEVAGGAEEESPDYRRSNHRIGTESELALARTDDWASEPASEQERQKYQDWQRDDRGRYEEGGRSFDGDEGRRAHLSQLREHTSEQSKRDDATRFSDEIDTQVCAVVLMERYAQQRVRVSDISIMSFW